MAAWNRIIQSGIIDAIGWTLVHSLWQGAACAILLGIALRLLRRKDASARYVVALGAMLVLSASIAVTFELLANRPNPPQALESHLEFITTFDSPQSVGVVSANTRWITPPSVPSLIERVHLLLPTLVLAWVAGVLLLCAYHLGGWMLVRRLRRAGAPIGETAIQSLFDELVQKFGIRRAVMLSQSAAIQVPMAIGWLWPIVLLPASALSGLTPQQLRGLLAHELAHIRRCDYLVNLIQTIVETLLFYHPAVWWIGRCIRQERENCCDDLAAAVCDRKTYAQALASMEELRQSSQLAMSARGGVLLPRIRRILGLPQDNRPWRSGMTLAALTILVAIGVIIAGCVARTSARADAPATQPIATRSLEESLILRGIVAADDNEYFAYVENLTTFNMVKLKVGDHIANGLIARITTDGVNYFRDGKDNWIAIGNNFLGDTSVSTGLTLARPRRAATQPADDADQSSNSQAISPVAADLKPPEGDYRIGPNDQVDISITGLTAPDRESVFAKRVTESGLITLPIIGELKIAGKTVAEAENAIRQQYKSQNILENASVSLTVTNALARIFTINFSGGIGQPGQYAIPQNDFRVLDALAMAKADIERLSEITIYRASLGPKARLVIPGAPLLAGEARFNIVIQPKDTIIVRGPVPSSASDSSVKPHEALVVQDIVKAQISRLRQSAATQPANQDLLNWIEALERRLLDLQIAESSQTSAPVTSVSTNPLGSTADQTESRLRLRRLQLELGKADTQLRELANQPADNPARLAAQKRDDALRAELQALQNSDSQSNTTAADPATSSSTSPQSIDVTIHTTVDVPEGGQLLVGGKPVPTTQAAALLSNKKAIADEYYITGVKRTGVYSMSGRKITLMNALVAAGMADEMDKKSLWVISHDAAGQISTKSYDMPNLEPGTNALRDNAALKTLYDVEVRPGDVLMVVDMPTTQPAAKASTAVRAAPENEGEYYVSGQVPRVGVYSLNDHEVTLLQAVISAGTNPEILQDATVVIVRKRSASRAQSFTFVRKDILEEGASFVIKPDDVIEVRSTKSSAKHFVRLVISEGPWLTFQGEPITLDQLKAALAKVADPAETALEIAVASDQVTVGARNQAFNLALKLCSELHLTYVSDVGVQPLGSKGGDKPAPATRP